MWPGDAPAWSRCEDGGRRPSWGLASSDRARGSRRARTRDCCSVPELPVQVPLPRSTFPGSAGTRGAPYGSASSGEGAGATSHLCRGRGLRSPHHWWPWTRFLVPIPAGRRGWSCAGARAPRGESQAPPCPGSGGREPLSFRERSCRDPEAQPIRQGSA